MYGGGDRKGAEAKTELAYFFYSPAAGHSLGILLQLLLAPVADAASLCHCFYNYVYILAQTKAAKASLEICSI